jgi:hypothetical protein
VSYNDRIHSLLSAIDRMIEERQNVNKIEREVEQGEENATVRVFAVNSREPVTADLMGEIEKTAVFARDEAQKLGFDASRIRAARDHRACRQFQIE